MKWVVTKTVAPARASSWIRSQKRPRLRTSTPAVGSARERMRGRWNRRKAAPAPLLEPRPGETAAPHLHPRGRLVEEEDPRTVHQAHGEPRALADPGGQV